MKKAHLVAAVVVLAHHDPNTYGQGQGDAQARGSSQVQQAFDAWRTANGGNWVMQLDGQTGYAALISGGASFVQRAKVDNEYRQAARVALAGSAALHGLRAGDLVLEDVTLLPLSLIGSNDKMAIVFSEARAGIPVRRARVGVLMDTEGRLLAIQSTGIPLDDSFDILPTTTAESGRRAALQWMVDASYQEPLATEGPRLAIWQKETAGGRRIPALAWETVVTVSAPHSVKRRLWIDANTGQRLGQESLLHNVQGVSGQIQSYVTPGHGAPDPVHNPPTSLEPMPGIYYYHEDSASTCVSFDPLFTIGPVPAGADGAFSFAGAPPAATEVLNYESDTVSVTRFTGGVYSACQRMDSPTNNTLTLNVEKAESSTAMANAFLWINRVRNYIRATNPADFHALTGKWAASVMDTSANLGDCQADADEAALSLRFAPSNGAIIGYCNDLSSASVVAHESGHLLNQMYGHGNNADGFGEGAADSWAMYLLDDPLIGDGYRGPGTSVRTGWNTLPFCGDTRDGCYGEEHLDGMVLMGALWKVRARLEDSLGHDEGALAADVLFNAWMNWSTDTRITTAIQSAWLALDDDDGNLDNGTPHGIEIDGGFQDQSFPAVFSPSVVFIDGANIGPGWFGTQIRPFSNLADGIARVATGGSLEISAGVYEASPIIVKKKLLLESANGTVVVQ